MLHLCQEIQIYQCQNLGMKASNKEAETPRIWLSAGTQLACENRPEEMKYCEGAFMPQEPWREPTPEESLLLWTEEPPPNDLGVGILKLPSEIIELFVNSGLSLLETPKQVAEFKDDPKCQPAFENLIDYLSALCLSEARPVINGMGGRQPGLSTSTIDNKRGCRNGLHTDNWDRLPLNQKYQATNRICINLGLEDRYFLFINLPEIMIFNLLGEPENALTKPWTRQQTAEFMKRYPNYPVVKLRIAPGEAYIAPTENIIHDGSTAGKKHLDIKIMLRGHYRIPA